MTWSPRTNGHKPPRPTPPSERPDNPQAQDNVAPLPSAASNVAPSSWTFRTTPFAWSVHDGCVDGEMDSSEERQPVSNDLQPARVCCVGLDEVQVANHNISRQSPSPECVPSITRPQPERNLHGGGLKRRMKSHTSQERTVKGRGRWKRRDTGNKWTTQDLSFSLNSILLMDPRPLLFSQFNFVLFHLSHKTQIPQCISNHFYVLFSLLLHPNFVLFPPSPLLSQKTFAGVFFSPFSCPLCPKSFFFFLFSCSLLQFFFVCALPIGYLLFSLSIILGYLFHTNHFGFFASSLSLSLLSVDPKGHC